MAKYTFGSALLHALIAQLSRGAEETLIANAAERLGLGPSGGKMIGMANRAAEWSASILRKHGKGNFPDTLIVCDDSGAEWTFDTGGIGWSGSKDQFDTLKRFLARFDAQAYVRVMSTLTFVFDNRMTLMERKQQSANLANGDEAIVIVGESMDGGGLVLIFKMQDGQIDPDGEPAVAHCGLKWEWGETQFVDHGQPELLPRPKTAFQ